LLVAVAILAVMWGSVLWEEVSQPPTGEDAALPQAGDGLAADRRAVAVPSVTAPSITLHPRAVALDYSSGEMVIEGTLVKGPGPAPDTVWVWGYFTAPTTNPKGSWSDAPIPLAAPFAQSDTAEVVARGPAHWTTNPNAPRRGYHARVRASAVSASAVQIPSAEREYSPRGTVRVTSRQ
jgi:hypothetical protein